MAESKALQTLEHDHGAAGAATEVEQIRDAGRLMVERKRALTELYQEIAGCEWGNLSGAALSPVARRNLARICQVTGAHPQLHVEILGGKPYLNAQFYMDLAAQDPHYLGSEQVNISPSVEAALRASGDEAENDAKALEGSTAPGDQEFVAELRREAAKNRARARRIAIERAEWGAPEWAEQVIITQIRRFRPGAPIAAINRGEVPPDDFVQEVRECNWAGGRPMAKRKRDNQEYEADPIGNAEPAKTARTRSWRRAARTAFSAWMEPLTEQIEKYEKAIEADYEMVVEDEAEERAALPAANGAQAVRTGGEPTAAAPAAAKPLPEDPAPAPAPRSAAAPKAPESPELQAEREKYSTGCQVAGVDEDLFAADKLGHPPQSLGDFRLLNAALKQMVDELEGDDDGEHQRDLLS